MSPELTNLGIEFVAISPDSPQEVSRFVKSHNWNITILSDETLTATDRYNLRIQKTFALGRKNILRDLAIPTTILVNAQGIVSWIDQASDYRTRSAPERVLGIIGEQLGVSAKSAIA